MGTQDFFRLVSEELISYRVARDGRAAGHVFVCFRDSVCDYWQDFYDRRTSGWWTGCTAALCWHPILCQRKFPVNQWPLPFVAYKFVFGKYLKPTVASMPLNCSHFHRWLASYNRQQRSQLLGFIVSVSEWTRWVWRDGNRLLHLLQVAILLGFVTITSSKRAGQYLPVLGCNCLRLKAIIFSMKCSMPKLYNTFAGGILYECPHAPASSIRERLVYR